MRFEPVSTTNVIHAQRAYEAISGRLTRADNQEGMALIYGRPGSGKTTTLTLLANDHDAVLLRAKSWWTPSSMMRDIARELGGDGRGRRDALAEFIIGELVRRRSPLFIDEVDYLVEKEVMMDTLRDIYDNARVPIMLVTHDDVPGTLRSDRRFARFHRRITEWVEFKPIDALDAEKVATQLLEVKLDRDLVHHIRDKVAGSIAYLVISFGQIEDFAKKNSLERLTLPEYLQNFREE